MVNWNVDEEKFKAKFPKDYGLWKMTQLINYGLDEGERLDRVEIKEKWDMIKERLDPYKRRAMEYLLWGKLYSLPNNLSFWNMFPAIQQ